MNLLILGAGEYGQLVKEMAKTMFDTIDFLDDKSEHAIGKIADLKIHVKNYKYAIVAIGNNSMRAKLFAELKSVGYKFPQLISEKAYISPSAKIDDGVIIEPMAIIQTGSIIRRGSIISSGSVINHNAVVNEYCHIDCNSVVGADAVIPPLTHVCYGQVITRDNNAKQ